MSLDSLTTIANTHDFDNTYTAEFENNVSGITLITPTTGKSLKITGIFYNHEGASAAGNMTALFLGSNTVAKLHPGTAPGSQNIEPFIVRGARNQALTLTSNLGNGKSYYLAINYKEE